MNSVIEVLKNMKKEQFKVIKQGKESERHFFQFGEKQKDYARLNALSEAIVCLKQKEKIKNIVRGEDYWIEKVLNKPADYEKERVTEAFYKYQILRGIKKELECEKE